LNVAIKLLTEVDDELMIYVHIHFMPEIKIGTLKDYSLPKVVNIRVKIIHQIASIWPALVYI